MRREKLPVLDIDGITPTVTRVFGTGEKHLYHFSNGYGASVVNHPYSYDWELAVIDHQGNILYNTPITKDVVGYIADQKELRTLLERISNLDNKDN